MWHYNEHYTYAPGVEAFAEFLEFENYESRLDSAGEPISLLDAVQLWLSYGDGLIHCPTFESALIATIAIIENWISQDQIAVDHREIWPFREGTVVRLSPNGDAFGKEPHPLLRREAYEQIQAMKRATDHEELSRELASIKTERSTHQIN